MYRKYQRPINASEARQAEKSLEAIVHIHYGGSLGCFGILGALAVACHLLSKLFKPDSAGETTTMIASWFLAGGAIIAILQLLTHVINKVTTGGKRKCQLQEIMDDGQVVVERVEATGVVELLETEDEGRTLFFDIGDGKILCLQGQDYYAANDNKPWPNTQFEIVATKRHKLGLGIFCYGEELKVSRMLKPDGFNYDHMPEVDVFDGALETLEEDLRKLAEKGSGRDKS